MVRHTSKEAAQTREGLRQNYDSIANEPDTWFFVAGNLGHSARILQEHHVVDLLDVSDPMRVRASARVEGPLLMLRGCRMECLLKALILSNGGRLGVGGRFVAPKGKAHDLLALARKAQLALERPEEFLLGYLGEFITQGRYPIGVRTPDTHRVLADGSPRGKVWSTDDEREYKALDQRVAALVSCRIRQRGAG